MDLTILKAAVTTFQRDLFRAIETATYGGAVYPNGHKAKEALIRSQTLIMGIHESVKQSFLTTLRYGTPFDWSSYPPLGAFSPEMKVFGKLKAKNQDLVFLRTRPVPTRIEDGGPNHGRIDILGPETAARSIVIGVRSQMSSVDNNFDTLMERAFAETLNLRLQTPVIAMGEVYVLPLRELKPQAMLENTVAFSDRAVAIEKFIRIFDAFTHRPDLEISNQYKYDASALVLIDLQVTPPFVACTGEDLRQYGCSDEVMAAFDRVSAQDFDRRLLNAYLRFQEQEGLFTDPVVAQQELL